MQHCSYVPIKFRILNAKHQWAAESTMGQGSISAMVREAIDDYNAKVRAE
jgi:hypothetical protein